MVCDIFPLVDWLSEVETGHSIGKLSKIVGEHWKEPYFFGSNGWASSFWTKCLFIFGSLESISDESKTMGEDQNFMVFQNMNSEIFVSVFV